MQSSDSSSSSTSSSSQKDAIADYLLQKFLKGNDPVRPTRKLNESQFAFARQTLQLGGSMFEQSSTDNQKKLSDVGAHALINVLECKCEESMLGRLVDELSPKLAEVFSGQSETLRPVLDILIARGAYPDPDKPSSLVIGGPMDIEDAERAWREDYQGEAHTMLLENIQRSFKPGSPYANSGSIIQSSGYGKSRTVDKMAMLIPTIPMNIRAERDATHGAFPPTDAKVIRMFKNMETSENPVHDLLFFFKELFGLVRDLAQGFKKEEDFTMSLYDYFKDQNNRAKFYTNLSEKMKKKPGDGIAKVAVASFKELAKLLPKSERPVKMVIYIDEAHTLAPWNVEGSSMYDHMLKATAEFASVDVFFLFLSTASRLEILASQATLSNSARFRAARNDLIAPFTEMPFDCHPSLVKEGILMEATPPGLMLEEIQKFSFAVRFGRPLFWAYYQAMLSSKVEAEARSATLAMAKGKLVANTTLSTPGNPGKLAILDTLLNLEYDPRRTHSHELASTMVASHMRTVYSVPPSRSYMHTGYPSEPVLAEAALTFINSHHTPEATDHEQTHIRPLVSFYRTVDANMAGAIDKGERGENVGKMILLMAYTAAVKNRSNPETRPQFWGEGCSLVDFLTELTGEEFCGDVLGSKPDNIQGGLPLEEKFEKSWVRFTHFARAGDDSAMTSSVALIAFIRGMAMIGWRSQQVVDVSIPILLDKDKPIAESNMSSILIQFKVRSALTTPDKVAVNAEDIKYFPPPRSRRDDFTNGEVLEDERKEYYTRPYISLVMELGLLASSGSGSMRRMVVDLLDNPKSQPPASKNKSKAPVLNVQARSQPPARARKRKRGSGVHASPPHIHPRYSLFYYGCCHKVYRCIQESEEAACIALLQIPTVFNDRSSNRPIDPTLQMKPFWSAGKNCYSWAGYRYLTLEYQESKLEDDYVLIGNPVVVDEDSDAID